MAENESNPQWKQKDMKLDETVKIKLVSPGAIASGTSRYGLWEMWKISVTNQKVHNKDNTVIENYSGEAIMFPPEKLREKFANATNGVNENVEVEITKKAETTERGGLYTDYKLKILSGGTPTVVSNSANPFMATPTSGGDSDLNGVEQKLVTEAKSAKQQVESTGGSLTKEQFVQGAVETYNVKNERAEIIWDKYMVQ